MAEMGIATNAPVQNLSIADYGKESLEYMEETKKILASIYGNLTSEGLNDEPRAEVTCLKENMLEIRNAAMQIREMARTINMALFNE